MTAGTGRTDAAGTKSKLAFGFDRGHDAGRDDLMPTVVALDRTPARRTHDRVTPEGLESS